MGLKEDYEAGATYLIGENIKKYEENHEVLNHNTNFKIKKMKAGRLLFSVVPLACSFRAFAFSPHSNNPSIKKFALSLSNNKLNFPVRLYVNHILSNMVLSL